MVKFNKTDIDLIKISYNMLQAFVEMCKDYLSDNDYIFYKRIIADIDFSKNIYNISYYLEFVTREIYNHCKF